MTTTKKLPNAVQIGFAIPSYRNAVSLRACLRSIAEHMPDALGTTVVVDDSGSGEVTDQLQSDFPSVTWISHDTNLGFAAAANRALIENSASIVVLLNDDVVIRSNLAADITRHFSAPELFALTFQSLDATGRFREGAKRLIWRVGIPRILHNPRDQRRPRNDRQPSDYAVGGHCAFHKARFAELGGFDLAFAPFYWEDVDLCLRARNRGWVTAYEANCVVTHDGPSAIRTNFEREKVRAIVWRNRIRFAYRHARGLQRRLLPLGLWLHRVAATVKSDYVLAAAIRNGVESSRQRSD